MKIEVDGKKYTVVENLGYNHSTGVYAKVVDVDGEEKVAIRAAVTCSPWHFQKPEDKLRPAGRYVGQ